MAVNSKEWVGVSVDLGCVLYVYLMTWLFRARWDWCLAAYGLLNLAGVIGYLTGHDGAGDGMSIAAALIAFAEIFFNISGRGKRLWGKIKSAALTAVNQASFRNQQKEAFS